MFRRAVAPGILLRQFVPEDAATLFSVVARQREYLRRWLPWVDQTLSIDDVAQFISRAQAQYDEGRGPQAAILLDGALAGSVGCHPIDWPNRNCSIGYWIDSGLQGRGLVTRSSAAMLDYLFDELDLHRVEIRCGTGNQRSCAIPERLGFVREGVARESERVNDTWVDLVVWSVLAPEWHGRVRDRA